MIPMTDYSRAEVVATKFAGDGMTPISWAVREGGCVLSKSGEWETEPIPSSRDDEFLARARFSSAENAAIIAKRHFKQND